MSVLPMATAVLAQTAVEITLSGQVKGLITGPDFKADVTRDLSDIPLTVRSSQLDQPDLFTAITTGQWAHWSYRLTLQVVAPDSYDSLADLESVVKTVVADLAGSEPDAISSSIVGQARPIGAPTSAVTGFGDALSRIESDAGWVLIAVVTVVIVLAVSLAYGPNIKRVMPRVG